MEKCKNQQRSRINKAFEKIPRFDGTNPSYCFNWLEQTEALVNEHQGRIYREELLCEEYGEAFSKNNKDIGRTKLVKMDIDTGDSPPVSSRPYTLSLKHYKWVQREIESLEHAGVITKSMSKWASPIVIIPKNQLLGNPLREDYMLILGK